MIDANNNGTISNDEGAAYARSVITHFQLQAGGTTLPLTLTTFDYPPQVDFNAGTGIIHLHMSAALAQTSPSSYQISYANSYAPGSFTSTYLVNSFVGSDVANLIHITDQQRDWYQHTLTLSYSVTDPQATSASQQSNGVDSTSLQQQLISYLHTTSLSPWLLIATFALAVVLGGIHALTPGHGKTLMAAYLIGSRGTLKHAVVLGSIVTITHTVSVLLIGLLTLFASQFILPNLLVPILETGAGLLVLLIGLRLIWIRWKSLRTKQGIQHPHIHQLPDNVRLGDLLAMGVSGGIVPCPEALGILLVAIGLNRIPLGMGLIISFSLGLAVVLIGLGVALVRFKPMLNRLSRQSRWQRFLPFISSLIVATLGVGIVAQAVFSSAIMLPVFAIVASVVILVLLLFSAIAHIAQERMRRPQVKAMATTDLSLLPPRYQNGKPVSSAPMGAAALVFDGTGQVAWNQIWTGFCDLALAGGPPHRGTLLEPVAPSEAFAQPDAYQQVLTELARGLRMVTGLEVVTDATPGWIGLICTDEAMALWLLRAIVVENVSVRREGKTLFFPAGPAFRLEAEIKNIVTVVAKTHHYWTEHITA